MKRPRVSLTSVAVSKAELTGLSLCLGALEQWRKRTEEAIIRIKTETEQIDKDRRTREEAEKKARANKI